MKKIIFILISIFSFSIFANSEVKLTNAARFHNSPKWFRVVDAESVTNKIQNKLEWSTRRVDVYFYSNLKEYLSKHKFGETAAAVTEHRGDKSSIFLGPQVSKDNFKLVFGHELVHVILRQKYKTAIPKWIEEGLANHLSGIKEVDYKWLAKQPFPEDVTHLAHPYNGSSSLVSYKYKASQALAQMLDKKCGLDNLIRLSVERKMENYIKTYCQIEDLNKAYQKWVLTKAKKI